MIGLIPRDCWEHRIADFFRALLSTHAHRPNIEGFYINGLGNCLPLRSGRAGLVLAIKALNLPTGAGIGVPLFCCSVVFKAIIAAGCKVEFIDVEPETFCMSPSDLSKKNKQVDAVIAVHMFGNLCDIHGMRLAAPGKPMIEDCAQALGSKSDDRPAGTFGDISFFSFRSGKYLSVGEGGALYSRDADICSRLSQLIAEMSAPIWREELVHVGKTYIKSILRSRPLYGVLGYHLWNILGKKINLNEKSAVHLSKIYKADFAVIKKRLSWLDSAIKKQRANADYFSRALKLEPGMQCREQQGTFYNRYHYPVTFSSKDERDYMADYLLKRGVDTIKYLDDIADIAARNYGYTGNCPISEQLAKSVLIIPSYYSLNDKDLQHIAQCLNEGWERMAAYAPMKAMTI